jgi:hypothetical protein
VWLLKILDKIFGGEIQMKKSMYLVVSLLVALSMLLAACTTATTEAPAVVTEAPAVVTEAPPAAAANPGLQMESAQVAPQFWSEEEYNKQKEMMTKAPLNPNDPIYLQYLEDSATDIT